MESASELRQITEPSRQLALKVVSGWVCLVYLAMSRFPRRPRFSDLPTSTQLDIKAFLGTYSRACEQSDSLLFSAGSTPTIDAACRSAQVGKLTGDALYVHETALTDLPAMLRVYEGCARVLVGRVDGGNVIKLHRFTTATWTR